MDSEEDEGNDNNDSDSGFDEERAYTLAVIVNTDFMYNEVTEVWKKNAEEMQKICQNLPNDQLPATNRIVMDEISRKTHEHCPGFNFSSIDEVTGRTQTSNIGASNLSDFRMQ